MFSLLHLQLVICS